MRHVYECPMRWADLDLLGHVNNVVYVDYLQEARVDLLRHHGPSARPQGGLAEGVVVVRHEVQFVSPLTFRFRPVHIEVWVTEVRAASFTLAYEVFSETDGERQVHARASTLLTPYVFETERPRRLTAEEKETLTAYLEPGEPVRTAATPTPVREDPGAYRVHVRFSDVDVYGHVNNVKYFEYFQEARLLLMARLGEGLPEDPGASVVVAQTDVDYRVPILFRDQPYEAWSWVSRLGRTSTTIESEICDGDTVLSRARVVVVFVDPATGRPTPPPAAYRERVAAATRTS
ncbi:acyl-CoA thioesterase [Nocardioides coralli]|uniref:acyl-CoA thioesterase n=1 Tax=Nocardioides coralli TaxID=2872154 RepID=UPI001CA40077|nr:thioesterase family protein [Nocardioides coralli]QZY28308.1 acyl-CoA thioesterase [Nocardioides coralli]